MKTIKCKGCQTEMVPIAEQRELFPDKKVKSSYFIYRCQSCKVEVEVRK